MYVRQNTDWARRHVTNKRRAAYVQAGKSDKTRSVNKVVRCSSAQPILIRYVIPHPRGNLGATNKLNPSTVVGATNAST